MKALILASVLLLSVVSVNANAGTEVNGRKAQRLYQALETLAQAKVAGVEEMVTNSNEGTEQDPDAYDQVTSLEIAGKIICIESASMSLKTKTADRYTCEVSK